MNERLQNAAFNALLAGAPLFAHLDPTERADVARLLRPFSAAAGETLFRQHAPPNGLYVIGRGRVVVSAQVFGDEEVTLGELGPGASLGEMALVDRQARSANARALEDTDGGFLDLHSFDGLRAWLHPSALKLMLHIAGALSQRLRELYARMAGAGHPAWPPTDAHAPGRVVEPSDIRLLRILPPIASFTDDELARLGEAGRCHELRRGQMLARAGEPTDRMFLVIRGALELRIVAPGAGPRVALLGPGSLTSQVSFLDPLPRSLACVAREDALVLSVPASVVAAWLAQCSLLSFKLAEAFVRAATIEVRVASRRQAQLAGEMHAVVVHTSSS